MLLKILTNKDKALRVVCKEIKEITPSVKKIASSMLATMKARQGVGLAANQVGYFIRLIIVRNIVMINPEIVKSKGNGLSLEGCLSFPNKQVTKYRATQLTVKWLDLNGIEQKEEIGGFDAFVVQHEIDHLQGITFLDWLGD